MKGHRWIMVGLLLLLFVSASHLFAAPYYERKTMNIVVGFPPGGGYDKLARLMAQFLPKYIPGKPTIVVQNMPGAAGIVATNHVYNLPRQDGLTIGTFSNGVMRAQLAKEEGVRYDLGKFAWIGSAGGVNTLLAIRSDLPYKTYADLLNSKNPIYIGATEVGGTTTFSILLKEFLRVNFRIVKGYPGTPEVILALERKEVDCIVSSYSTIKPLVDRGIARPMIRSRTFVPGLESVPVNEDLATDKLGKTIMAIQCAMNESGRIYAAPPKTPPDVVGILRDAFAKVLNDPEVKDVGKKTMLELDHISAEGLTKVIKYVFDQPEEILKEYRKYL